MIIGFCGQAGSGKDTSADFLVKNDQFVKVAFADPLKRICQEVYDFTDDQLWGPSSSRNAPDVRYPRGETTGVAHEEKCRKCRAFHVAPVAGSIVLREGESLHGKDCPKGWQHDVVQATHIGQLYLTPRYALQKLGTEWGRDCYDNTWVDLALRIAKRLGEGGHTYNFRRGLSSCSFVGEDAAGAHDRLKRSVVISDVRFKNEIDAIRKAGGIVIKLLRGEGLEGAAGQHKSETELQGIPLESFDFIIDNREWTLNQLELYLHQLIQLHQGK